MATYVVGDIHGCYDEWMTLHNRIIELDPGAKFILIGDIIDRGDQSIEMINWMLANVDNSSEQSKYRMIMGNHEFEKIEWWSEVKGIWDAVGGGCYDRYDFDAVLRNVDFNASAVDSLISKFNALPYYIDTIVNGRRFIIAHANIPSSIKRNDGTLIPSNRLCHRDKSGIVWERKYGGIDINAIVINGHTPTTLMLGEGVYDAIPGKCYHKDNRYIIDCGLVYKSKIKYNLCALRLEDLEEFYLYSDKEILGRYNALVGE